MGIAEPLSELASTAGFDWVVSNVSSKIVRTYPARVKLREKLDEANKIILLGRAWRHGISGCHGMKQRPSAPAEGLNVGWTVRGLWYWSGQNRGC